MDIAVNNLRHTFDGRVLFDKLSFEIRSGQRIRIAGGSGSGKSMLLEIIAGLAVPTQGEIHIGTDDLTTPSVWDVRRQIAYVAQEPELGEGIVLERIRRPVPMAPNKK